jgi:hypothetical protein
MELHNKIDQAKKFMRVNAIVFLNDHDHADDDGLAELTCEKFGFRRQNGDVPRWIQLYARRSFDMAYDVVYCGGWD